MAAVQAQCVADESAGNQLHSFGGQWLLEHFAMDANYMVVVCSIFPSLRPKNSHVSS